MKLLLTIILVIIQSVSFGNETVHKAEDLNALYIMNYINTKYPDYRCEFSHAAADKSFLVYRNKESYLIFNSGFVTHKWTINGVDSDKSKFTAKPIFIKYTAPNGNVNKLLLGGEIKLNSKHNYELYIDFGNSIYLVVSIKKRLCINRLC